MDAEYFGCNDGGDGKAVENVNEGFPSLDVAATLAFVIEAVHCQRVSNAHGAERAVETNLA